MRVLLTDSDYLTIRAYVEFMNMLADEISRGKTVWRYCHAGAEHRNAGKPSITQLCWTKPGTLTRLFRWMSKIADAWFSQVLFSMI